MVPPLFVYGGHSGILQVPSSVVHFYITVPTGYCMVDQPKTKAGAFGNNIVVAAVNDTDVYYTTGLALAWIGGYDSWNNYQEDDDDDSN